MPFRQLWITSACLKLRPLETYIPDAFISIANISEAPGKILNISDLKIHHFCRWRSESERACLPRYIKGSLFQGFRLWGRRKEMWAGKTASGGVGSEGEIPSSLPLPLPLPLFLLIFFPFSNFTPQSTISKPGTGSGLSLRFQGAG